LHETISAAEQVARKSLLPSDQLESSRADLFDESEDDFVRRVVAIFSQLVAKFFAKSCRRSTISLSS